MAEQPLVKKILVPRPVVDAFRLFTLEVATWWPLRSHSVAGASAALCAIETRKGGQIYEQAKTGERHVWGTILQWDPPHRIVFTWHPGRDDETAQRVEVRFLEHGDGTLLELTQHDWEEAFGPAASEARTRYDSGWDEVLGSYRDAA